MEWGDNCKEAPGWGGNCREGPGVGMVMWGRGEITAGETLGWGEGGLVVNLSKLRLHWDMPQDRGIKMLWPGRHRYVWGGSPGRS